MARIRSFLRDILLFSDAVEERRGLDEQLLPTAMTAAEFLADLKFAEAKRLLMNTASSIEGIARASGLRNDQAMQRLFQARTGLSPRQWRTANRP